MRKQRNRNTSTNKVKQQYKDTLFHADNDDDEHLVISVRTTTARTAASESITRFQRR
jgi:hypothetical protein